MLLSRILTALVLLPLSIYGILYLDLSIYAIIVSLLFFIGALEWCKITQLDKPFQTIFIAGLIAIQWLLWENLSSSVLPSLVIATSLFWLFAFYQVLTYPDSAKLGLSNKFFTSIIGYLLLIPAWLVMILLKAETEVSLGGVVVDGGMAVLILMCIVWIADTGAYFSGRKWGNKKLLPQVSPGKTRAGAWGAIILTVLVASILYIKYSTAIAGLIPALIALVIITIFSIVGDLYESLFKRLNNIKDSGTILPGHGGVLDRIDSLTAAAPLFYVATLLL